MQETRQKKGLQTMVFQNIEFHNVAEIVPFEDGWRMWRVPQAVREKCSEGLLTTTAGYNTGVELRFRVLGEYADIHLRTLPIAEGQMAYLYYGAIQGGWQNSSFIITRERTTIRVPRPGNLEKLRRITEGAGLSFDPEVARLVLPYGTAVFLGVDGEVAPPEKAMLPATTYMAYGSSITHGSLALAMPMTYPFRIAQRFGCDYLNMGFAGTAHCEKEMAQWLVSRKDWDFASLEMGINMLGMEEKAFEERIDVFTGIMADDGRPVFATSLFGFNGDHSGDGPDKATVFRNIVRKYAEPRLNFIDGLELLNRPEYISQDMVHPTFEGIDQVAGRWHAHMAAKLPEGFIR